MKLRPYGWSKEEILYGVYIRELNRVLSTELYILYTTDHGLYAYYNYPTLKYMYFP